MRFRRLRKLTGLPDASLSKHLTVLGQSGYVTRFREYGSTRAKDTVWVTLTAQGEEAFEAHVAALRQLADAGA